MYQNCCKKCGSTSLHTDQKGNNIGLYCDDCGAWIKWLSKDELRAFEHSQKDSGSAIDFDKKVLRNSWLQIMTILKETGYDSLYQDDVSNVANVIRKELGI